MTLYRDISITSIDVGGRLRALDPAWVTLLAEEIGATGQSTPIRVVERGKGFKLVDGARRIAALLQLGRENVEARVEDAEALADDAAIRLGEIKGNMLRGDLTVLDRARYLATWRDIYLSVHEVSKGGRKRAAAAPAETEELSAKFALSFSEAAQQALQISRRSLFLALKIAGIERTTADRIAHHLVATKQTELLLLADQSEARQLAVVDMLTSEPARAQSVSEAVVILGGAAVPAPLAAYERINDRLSALKLAERERLYDLRADEIEIWFARRNSVSRPKVA